MHRRSGWWAAVAIVALLLVAWALVPEMSDRRGRPTEFDLAQLAVYTYRHETGRFPADLLDAAPYFRKKFGESFREVRQAGPGEYVIVIDRRRVPRIHVWYELDAQGDVATFRIGSPPADSPD